MSPPRDRLFHVLVTLGIAAGAGTACGKSRSTESDEGAGGSSGSDPNGTGVSGDTSSTGGTGIATGGFGGIISTGGAGAATGGTGVSIGGNFGVGGEGGDGCQSTAQIICREYEPEPFDCACDPNGPITTEDCNGRGQFRCYSYEPPLGCTCVFITGPR